MDVELNTKNNDNYKTDSKRKRFADYGKRNN